MAAGRGPQLVHCLLVLSELTFSLLLVCTPVCCCSVLATLGPTSCPFLAGGSRVGCVPGTGFGVLISFLFLLGRLRVCCGEGSAFVGKISCLSRVGGGLVCCCRDSAF